MRVGCFLPWCRSWSHSRRQPLIKRSKLNWWSQQSWLGKVFELRWCFQKRLNEDMANKQTSLIFNSSSANKKNSLYSQGWFKCGNRSAWERFFKSPPPTVIDSELLASIRGWWWFQSVLANRMPRTRRWDFPWIKVVVLNRKDRQNIHRGETTSAWHFGNYFVYRPNNEVDTVIDK